MIIRTLNVLRLILAILTASLGLLVVLPLAILGVPFWCVSGVTRLADLVMTRFKTRPATWEELIEFEPSVGWKNVSDLEVDALGEGEKVFRLTTDADGWRGTTSLEESDIVVFGDSFAFGFGADDDTFFGALHPTLQIKTVGANGYNMVQELLWMERLSAKLAGKLVVWFVYYGNDLYENLQPNLLHYRMPFVRRSNGSLSWEVVTSNVHRGPWPFAARPDYGARFGEICSPTPLSQRVWGACRFLISRGLDVCGEAGATLAVVAIPARRQLTPRGRARMVASAPDPRACDPGLPDRMIGAICRDLSVPFLALSEHLSDSDCFGTHWSAQGHKRVSEILANLHTALLATPLAEPKARQGAAK